MIPSPETNSKFTPENCWKFETIFSGKRQKTGYRLDFRGSVYTILSFRYLSFCHVIVSRCGRAHGDANAGSEDT